MIPLPARALLLAAALLAVLASAQDAADPIDVAAVAGKVVREFDPDGPALLPFSAMREAGDHVEVRLAGDDRWYRWERIDAARADDVAAVCRAAFADRWWKRITEDLVMVLALMGHETGPTVDLVLRAADGSRVVRRGVAMTHDNRQRVKAASERGAKPARPLTGAELAADLDTLETLLGERFAYATMLGVDPARAVDELRAELGAGATVAELALAVQRCVARFSDGHAGVADLHAHLPRRWLPFLVEQSAAGLVAIRPERDGFVDAEHPFVARLDGRPIREWLDAAERVVPAGSGQLVRRRAVRWLREWLAVRALAGAAPLREVRVELHDGRGRRVTRTLPLATRRPTYGVWPRPRPHALLADGAVGYLRIPQMAADDEVLDEIDAAMERFRDTRGLIVDVRGNGGGTRDVLRRFLPWLMAPGESPAVVNAAAPRLAAGAPGRRDESLLADRFLFPAGSPHWSAAARQAVAAAERAFEPTWRPPARAFGAWHWMVVERDGGRATYHYDRPVVVLLDHDCFSATDVFLGALHGRPGVTLLGTPSGGGSARARGHRLPHSGLTVRLASMASFRPDGTPYDGVGIAPDVVVEPPPGDLVGRGDRQLELALQRLTR